MKRRFLAAGFILAMLMVSVSGCLTGDGEEKDENSIPDDIKHLNAGANGMSHELHGLDPHECGCEPR